MNILWWCYFFSFFSSFFSFFFDILNRIFSRWNFEVVFIWIEKYYMEWLLNEIINVYVKMFHSSSIIFFLLFLFFALTIYIVFSSSPTSPHYYYVAFNYFFSMSFFLFSSIIKTKLIMSVFTPISLINNYVPFSLSLPGTSFLNQPFFTYTKHTHTDTHTNTYTR